MINLKTIVRSRNYSKFNSTSRHYGKNRKLFQNHVLPADEKPFSFDEIDRELFPEGSIVDFDGSIVDFDWFKIDSQVKILKLTILLTMNIMREIVKIFGLGIN